MFPVFEVTGWSRVPGDRAIIEAADETAARAVLRALLSTDDRDDEPTTPIAEWCVVALSRPLGLIVWRD
jgi:hypothetical protein